MKLVGWVALLIAVAVAVFAIQNSTLPVIPLKFLAWRIETSPVYALLGSFVGGILAAALMWVPHAVRESFRRRNLKKQIQVLEQKEKGNDEAGPRLHDETHRDSHA